MDPDLTVIESIYDALDTGRFTDALSQARAALEDLPEDDPVLRFLALSKVVFIIDAYKSSCAILIWYVKSL